MLNNLYVALRVKGRYFGIALSLSVFIFFFFFADEMVFVVIGSGEPGARLAWISLFATFTVGQRGKITA